MPAKGEAPSQKDKRPVVKDSRGELLMQQDDKCPSCKDGKLLNTVEFTLQCDRCHVVLNKRCPTFYERIMCTGCPYQPGCAKRMNVPGAANRAARLGEDHG